MFALAALRRPTLRACPAWAFAGLHWRPPSGARCVKAGSRAGAAQDVAARNKILAWRRTLQGDANARNNCCDQKPRHRVSHVARASAKRERVRSHAVGFSGMDIRRATLASPGAARCVKAGVQRLTHGRRPHLALAQKPGDKFLRSGARRSLTNSWLRAGASCRQFKAREKG